jgi:hypothetical protein
MLAERPHAAAQAADEELLAVELSPPAERPLHRINRAGSRVRAGLVAEAVAEADELTMNPTWPAQHCYNFACIYALASAKTNERQKEYADRAMEMLHQAVRLGWSDAGHTALDDDLDALRSRADFKKLLVEMRAKSGQK